MPRIIQPLRPKIVYYPSDFVLYSSKDVPWPLIDYYVYEWLDIAPFYIGMGHSRRAWNQHLPHIEERREAAKHFRVRIVAHRMTKRRAHIYERELIARRIRQGFNLVNKRIPC